MTLIAIATTQGGQPVFESGRVPLLMVGIGFVLVGGPTSGWWRHKPKRSTRIQPSSRPDDGFRFSV